MEARLTGLDDNMHKRFIAIVAAILALALVSEAHCASRYQDGFRGIAWGTTKEKLPDLGLSEKSLNRIYKTGPSAVIFMEGKGNLDLSLDGVPLLSLFLRFNDMAFYGFDMVFKAEYAEKVRSIMETDMQTPGEKTDDGYSWKKDGLNVIVTDRELMVVKE